VSSCCDEASVPVVLASTPAAEACAGIYVAHADLYAGPPSRTQVKGFYKRAEKRLLALLPPEDHLMLVRLPGIAQRAGVGSGRDGKWQT